MAVIIYVLFWTLVRLLCTQSRLICNETISTVNLRNRAARSSSWLLMRLKILIFRGNTLIYIKGLHIFHWPTFSPPRSLSPRYLFHVLRNSIAPSPLVQARHLDRLDPTMRSQWIREWRSLRGGGQVKRPRLSTPPSPTLEPHVNMYPQSPVTSADEISLYFITENYLRPWHTWDTTTWLQLYYLFWKM